MNENNRGLPRYSYYLLDVLKIIETTLETSREHKLSLINDKPNEILLECNSVINKLKDAIHQATNTDDREKKLDDIGKEIDKLIKYINYLKETHTIHVELNEMIKKISMM